MGESVSVKSSLSEVYLATPQELFPLLNRFTRVTCKDCCQEDYSLPVADWLRRDCSPESL